MSSATAGRPSGEDGRELALRFVTQALAVIRELARRYTIKHIERIIPDPLDPVVHAAVAKAVAKAAVQANEAVRQRQQGKVVDTPEAPAAAAMTWDADAVIPEVHLESGTGEDLEAWEPQRDLLDPLAREAVHDAGLMPVLPDIPGQGHP